MTSERELARRGALVVILTLLGGCGSVVTPAADAGGGDPAGPCVAPYQLVMGGCYRVSTSFVSWPTAETACEADGAHLATIDNVPEHSVLHTLGTGAAVTEVWIGYTDHVTEGTFRWVSVGGLDPSTDKCFFGTAGPVNSAEDDCVVQESANACGDWFVRDCSLTRPYICERDGHVAMSSAF
jgi:hypothetical protein